MRLRPIVAATAAAALITGAVAPMAQAYDREAYEYAAGHMIDRTDIPKSLGTFDPVLGLNVGRSYKTFLCYISPGDESAPADDITIAKGKRQSSGFYNSAKDTGPNVNIQVTEYASATAAIKAFETLKKQAKKCTGTGSSTFTDDDGTSYTSSWEVSNAVVPSVAVVGVQSISITQDNLSTNSSSDDKYLNDNYTVYSLVNDAIIQTAYYMNGPKNITTAQRKAVNQLAFNAIGRWLG